MTEPIKVWAVVDHQTGMVFMETIAIREFEAKAYHMINFKWDDKKFAVVPFTITLGHKDQLHDMLS